MTETFNKDVVLEDIEAMQRLLLSMHEAMKMIYDKLTSIKREAQENE